jgi:hypothetical protein
MSNNGTIIKKGSKIKIKLRDDSEPIDGAVMHDYDWESDGPLWIIEDGFNIEVHEVRVDLATSIVVDGVDWLRRNNVIAAGLSLALPTQFEFDLGTWGIAAEALGQAMAGAREARQLVEEQIAKAVEATRADRRARLEGQHVAAWWSDHRGVLMIYDATLMYERDFHGHWSVNHADYGSDGYLSPWAHWTPVDLGSVETERALHDARLFADTMADMNRLPRDLRRKVEARRRALWRR